MEKQQNKRAIKQKEFNAVKSIIDFLDFTGGLLFLVSRRYFQKRILNENVPEEWVQAILDKNSSAKKGRSGENKLIHILGLNGIKEVGEWQDFFSNDCCVLRFSKK